MITEGQRRFLDHCRVGRLATADRDGMPHVVPVCFAVFDATLYVTIDEKAKRRDRPLKRLRNIAENPRAAFVADHWDEDWSRLGWVMLRGRAEILDSGAEHDRAQALLATRYPQYRAMRLGELPVIALRIARATAWGDLSGQPRCQRRRRRASSVGGMPEEGAMAVHDHDPDEHPHGSELSEVQLRVRALETILTEKGYVDPAALDRIVEDAETRIGPHLGARLVARAWADGEFKRRLLQDATEAANSLGYQSPVGAHLIAVENTPQTHNIVVCTLCSCYPWEVLGLPPVWYKSAPYRSRTVIDPKGVLAEFGVQLPPESSIRVWDSTAETRFLVVPMRPSGTDGWSEEALAELVTRDSMVGTGLAKAPADIRR